jgi:hypothetical protein
MEIDRVNEVLLVPEASNRYLTHPEMVKILECSERPRFSMMDVEDEHHYMGAAFGLRDRIGQPGTAAAE